MTVGGDPGSVMPVTAFSPRGRLELPCHLFAAAMEDMDDMLSRKKADLDELKPLGRKTLSALSSWYDVELTYRSNVIEGNALTRSETAIVLEKE